ncbi:MAG: redoxin domain-containing protein [Candidatus Hydrogenedentes bacterium]|nr:redoxin domain-containing protein [Candidatus Hydrogenedentota bacterium]
MKTKAMLGVATLVACVGVGGVAFMMNEMALADVADPPAIGTDFPSFNMTDYEGKTHSLDEYKDKVLVLSFTSQGCPYSRAADPIYANLMQEYKDDGVVFLSVDADKNNAPSDIEEYATAKNETGKKLPYPVLKDEMNKYADTMGATRTPEIYIKDKDGKLVYHGAIDNQKKTDDPEYVNYVKSALDEVLAGKPVSTPSKSAYGCGIKRAS